MRSLQFIRRGQPIALANVPPDRTLLQVLREDLGHTGTKEGCGEGDCGACTVVVGEAENGRMTYRAINACICLAHSIDGKALWTAEDLAQDPLIQPVDAPVSQGSALHPVQQALVEHHASQCGFCTPGFVMSLFALYQNQVCHGQPVTREQAVQDLSGNLCRCTGYRPILDAAQEMHTLPRMQVDEAALLQKMELLAHDHKALEADLTYISPTTLDALLAARAAHPQAQLVAGCTDAGLWVTKQHRQFGQVLDVTRVAELRQITEAADHTVLASPRGERTLALEDLYTGYRQNVLAPDEVLARILVPHPAKGELLRAYKISKRFDDDISAVCLVLCLHLEDGAVRSASIGAGGVAAVPARARQAEAALTGQPWDEAAVQRAAQALQTEFTPLSDMRASSQYRSTVLARLVQRFWLESQGHTEVSLESLRLEESA